MKFYAETARFVAYRVQPKAEYIHGANPDGIDLAARYFVSVAAVDIGLSYFNGPIARRHSARWR
ncbi:hypothetical protein [Pseudomonas zeae]|uniref:hypothetical protein n=1 Tax=Pseudomonas zeae TaxID=2745510 RepID=UPI0039E18B34